MRERSPSFVQASFFVHCKMQGIKRKCPGLKVSTTYFFPFPYRLFELSKMIPAAMVKRMNCHCNRLTGPDPDIATAQAIASEKAMRANFEAESLRRARNLRKPRNGGVI